MKMYGFALAGLFLLAGCGGDASPAPAPSRDPEAMPAPPVMGQERHIVALGDSLFAGYGLKAGEGYPARLEAALRARGINARMVDAGVSGDTTAGGLQRLAFTLDAQAAKPDLVVISLGGNDLLRGLPPEQTRANLDAILAELDRRGIRAVLMGMLSPPNMGADYRAAFDPIYPALAKKHGAGLVPFFLQPVTGRPDLVQADHIHPTAVGIEAMVAATIETVAKELPAGASPAAPPPPR